MYAMDEETLISEYEGLIHHLCKMYGGINEDALQVGRMAIMEANRKYDESKSNGNGFKAYACWLVKCRLLNHNAKEWTYQQTLANCEFEDISTYNDEYNLDEIWVYLEELDDEAKDYLILQAIHGKSIRDIASAKGIKYHKVKVSLRKSKDYLQSRIKKD